MKKAFKLGCGSIVAILVILFIVGIFATDDLSGTEASTGTVTTEKGETKEKIEILQITDKYESYMKSYTLHTRVKNNTNNLVGYLQLNATFYDKDGKIVGTGMGNTTNLSAGAERTVDIMALEIENAASYEVEVENVMYD